MFEIYRETGYNHGFRCVFYTELEEHARDKEIAKAAAGQTVFSGFVSDERREAAREAVEAIVDELNDLDEADAPPPPSTITARLEAFLVP
jgi:dihydropteroate synthase